MEAMLLTAAHKQWANRPPDERVPDLETLYQRAKTQFKESREKEVPFSSLRVEAQNEDIFLTRGSGSALLTNWSFSQLCGRVGAPTSYLQELPATLAVQNLNHGLTKRIAEATGRETAKLLFSQNGALRLRALNTDIYERFWNYEVAERLLGLKAKGWEPSVPDFNKSEDDFPSLYLGDRDMFAFIRLRNVAIEQPVKSKMGDNAPIYKGAIYENSEVGAKKIRVWKFWYNGMCGNHCIWGATDVMEFEARHVGNVRDKVKLFDMQLRKYAEESVTEDAAGIKKAARKIIAATKEEVLDLLFGKRTLALSRKVLEAGYDAVVPEQDGNPNTVWGMVQGLTRFSQTLQYADARTQVDKAAGRIMDLVDSF
jgi:IS1 family transposase